MATTAKTNKATVNRAIDRTTVRTNTKKVASQAIGWSVTILTLAIACAAMSMLIGQNQDLRTEMKAMATEQSS